MGYLIYEWIPDILNRCEILGYDIPHFLCLFLIWSFLGWIVDVGGTSAHDGYYSPRGFLSLPLCPIYGFGAMLVIFIFRPLMDNLILLYIGSSLICTSWELTVGLLLESLFKAKWWDYSDERYNFKGLISLRCALLWGLLCTAALYILIPVTEQFVFYLPVKECLLVAIPLYMLITADTVHAVRNAVHRPSLSPVSQLFGHFEKMSDLIGSAVAGSLLFLLFNNRILFKK